MGNGESYQFRHIFFCAMPVSLFFENTGAIRRLFSTDLFFVSAAQILRGVPFSELHFYTPLGAGGCRGSALASADGV